MADSQVFSGDLNKLKVADLKKMLEERNLPLTGKKADLIERLKEAGFEQDDVDVDEPTADHEIDDLLKDDDDDDEIQIENEKENETTEAISIEESPAKPKLTSRIEWSDDTVVSDSDKVKTDTDNEKSKKDLRAERFGISADKAKSAPEKLVKRAERFGIDAVSSSVKGGDDVDKLKARAARFGQVTSSALTSTESTELLKKRAERFGQVTSTTLSKTEDVERLLKRKQKFGVVTSTSSESSEAKRQRAERFGLKA